MYEANNSEKVIVLSIYSIIGSAVVSGIFGIVPGLVFGGLLIVACIIKYRTVIVDESGVYYANPILRKKRKLKRNDISFVAYRNNSIYALDKRVMILKELDKEIIRFKMLNNNELEQFKKFLREQGMLQKDM